MSSLSVSGRVEPSAAQRGDFFLEQALLLDEAGNSEEALPLYRDAAASLMAALSACSEGTEKTALQGKVMRVLDRAEALKGIHKRSTNDTG